MGKKRAQLSVRQSSHVRWSAWKISFSIRERFHTFLAIWVRTFLIRVSTTFPYWVNLFLFNLHSVVQLAPYIVPCYFGLMSPVVTRCRLLEALFCCEVYVGRFLTGCIHQLYVRLQIFPTEPKYSSCLDHLNTIVCGPRCWLLYNSIHNLLCMKHFMLIVLQNKLEPL